MICFKKSLILLLLFAAEALHASQMSMGENEQKATQKMFDIINLINKDNIVQQSKALQSLLQRNPGIINNKDVHGVPALNRAVKKGNSKIIQQLIDAGANPNAQNKAGYTALMWGAIEGDKEIIQILILAGARPETQVSGDRAYLGATALDFAREKGNEDVYQDALKEAERYKQERQVARRELEQVMIPELAALTEGYAYNPSSTIDLPKNALQQTEDITKELQIKRNIKASRKKSLQQNRCPIQ